MKLITFAGCDASGKSTIISNLKSIYPATYIREPSNDIVKSQILSCTDPIEKVELFADDRGQLYSSLHDYTLPIISDRSFICSMVYQSIEITFAPLIESLYYIFEANKERLIPIPNTVIYLYCDAYVIHHRLSSRKNDHALSVDQICAIQQRYQLVFQLLNIKPIVIDTTCLSPKQCVDMILSHLP